MVRPRTQSQRDALKWLLEHNSDGVFDNNGVLLAGGELAPHTRSTWNKLYADGFVEFYRINPLGAQRCRIKPTGEL